jgi:hypothetical protein
MRQMAAEVQKQARIAADSTRSGLRRKCDKCRKNKLHLQRSTKRDFMEPRLGHDFSQIPVHSRSPTSLQAKLAVNPPGDIYEQEADRIADQVLSAPVAPVGGALPRIQRFSGQTDQSDMQMGTAPSSVDRVLASSGRPLEPALLQDMEGRFGHDFSRVRVHLGSAAEQSAREVNAHAFTVGRNIAFDEGRFAPGTHEGRRLIAHELTHVVQQSEATGIRDGQSNEKRDLSLISTAPGLQRKNGNETDKDPVVELKQVGDTWHLKLRGFTDVKAAERRIWSSKTPKGVANHSVSY